MKRAGKILAFLCFGGFLLLGAGVLAFYHLIQSGDFRAFLVHEIEQQTQFKVQLGDGSLEVGRIIGVGFRNVAFAEPEGGSNALTAQHVTARVALLPLLRRRFIVNEVRLSAPVVRLVRDRDGKFPLLDRLANLPFLQQDHGQFSVDLRAIRISAGAVDFEDHYLEKDPVQTQLRHLDLDLKRLRGQALREFLQKLVRQQIDSDQGVLEFDLKTAVERERQRARVQAAGTMMFPSEKLEFAKMRLKATAQVNDAPAALIQALSSGRIAAKSLNGNFDAQLVVEGQVQQKLQLKGDIKFAGLAVEAPALFSAPLNPGKGELTVQLDWQPPHLLDVARFDLNTSDLKLNARGVLRKMPNQQAQIQLSALAPSLSVAVFKKYLPAKGLASPQLDQLMTSLQEGEIEIKRLGLAANLGELKQLSFDGLRDRLSLEVELRKFAGRFGANSLPMRGVQGNVTFDKGLFSLKNLRGSYGQTRLDDLDGTYRVLAQGQSHLDVRSQGELDLAELREQLKQDGAPVQLAKLSQQLREAAGRAKFEIALQRTTPAPPVAEGKLILDGARLHFDRYALADVKGELVFTPQEIRAEKARAVLNGSPAQIRFSARNYAAENGVFDLRVDSNEMKAGVVTTLFQPKASLSDPGMVRGWVRYQGPLANREGRKFTGNLELAGVQLHLQPLLQPLRELNGTIKFDDGGIDFQNIQGLLVGAPASVNGRWRFGQKTPLFFDFASANLDLQYLMTQIDHEAAEFYANLEAVGKISLARGRYKSFEFTDLKTDVVIDHRVWKLSRLALNAGGGTLQGTAVIHDKPDVVEFSVEPKMQSVPVRNLLSWFEGGRAEMTGRVNIAGRLESVGKDGAERLKNLSGAFHLRVEDGTIRRMRVLVQILNLLDLSRWFTFQVPDFDKRGINFRSITADFKVNRGVYTTNNLIVDSDDLRMTGAGKIDSPKDEMEFTIAVRPFAGIDTGLNQIPLIGTGIAAIKNSFLVANFNIKGSMDNPTITPAPLSTLSEWVLGILRIPKSMLTLPGGEKKDPAEVAPREPPQ
ncbi:MAG: AsmA family protein [Deltaproteobacteria bacterium]|nr:AsmA family protein [Deltaproteobacteria bacterium]